MNSEPSTKISIDDFKNLEMKVGTILEADEIEGSDKLLKLKVDLGEDSPRQVLSGIKQWYLPSDLVNQQAVFVTNLQPREIMGLQSQAMILAASDEKPILLIPQTKVTPGAKIR